MWIIKTAEKRTARAKAIFDVDDFLVLEYITRQTTANLTPMKESLKISHRGLLTHINRLLALEFIKITPNKENYKIKEISLTTDGSKFYKYLIKHISKIEKEM